jgi:hypothetical protein
VLAENPHTAEASKIKDIAIVRTVTGGSDGISGMKSGRRK